MIKDKIFTMEEVSEYLRVPLEVVQQQINAGKLSALDLVGNIRIQESDLNAYLNGAKLVNPPLRPDQEKRERNLPNLASAPDFTYTWPNENKERFAEVREGIASYGGKEYHVKLGFTVRKSAGKARRRCLVLVDRYATVEFVAANEFGNGKMASIIRDRNGKQLPVGGTLPPEYQDLPVEPYRHVVIGPGASNGMAVACGAQDLATMVKHALIRYRYREDRASKKRGPG